MTATVYVIAMDMDNCISKYSGTIALRFVYKKSFLLFPIVIVTATSPLGTLESKIRSDDDVHIISVTSSS